MSDELERICKEAVWPNFEGLSGIRLESLREATRNLSQDSRSPGRDLNPGPPKYEAHFPTTRPRRTILRYHVPFCYVLYVLHRLSCIQRIITCKYVRREPGSSVSIVSAYGLDDRAIGFRFPAGAKNFSSILCVQTGCGSHPASCPIGTGGSFPGGKARPGHDADHSPPSSAEVVNE
jgi:hypothetical protein